MASAPIFVGTPNTCVAKFVNADGTAKKTIFTAGASGGRVEAILIASNDTAANTALLYVSNGGTDYFLGSVSILAAVAPAIVQVSALAGCAWTSPMDGGIILKSGDLLKVSMNAAVTAAKETSVTTLGGDF